MSSDLGNFLFIPSSGLTSTTLSLELSICFILFVAVITFWLTPGGLAWALSKARKRSGAAIPGPSGLPLLGMGLTFTNSLTHRVLSKISKTLNAEHLMAFSVGFTRYIISSNPETAKEILNSPEFADRPIKETAYGLLFDRSMGFAPYGDYWRNLRRISATYMFSPKVVSGTGGLRKDLGSKMVGEIKHKMDKHGEVEVKHVFHYGSLNHMMATVFGKCYDFEGENNEGAQLSEMVNEGYALLGVFNWSDHIPLVGLLDLHGVRKRCSKLVEKVNVLVGKIIEEHREKRAQIGVTENSGDFVDVLLDLEKENNLSDSDKIAVLWEMIFRGTDTVSILLEWILARMVLHPDIQSKAQNEIDTVVGPNKAVSHSDLAYLPYLNAIISETLRMHPPGPLLSWARSAIHDTHVGKHFIPAGTTAMVNMWAITHDEKVWSKPEKFMPERFVNEDVSVMGSDLRLAPFGAGRRVCPGKAMGMATVQLWLAQMLQNFNWVDSGNGVDLSERLELSMEMKQPLVCKAIPRMTTV